MSLLRSLKPTDSLSLKNPNKTLWQTTMPPLSLTLHIALFVAQALNLTFTALIVLCISATLTQNNQLRFGNLAEC
jgi:hypothetical protein